MALCAKIDADCCYGWQMPGDTADESTGVIYQTSSSKLLPRALLNHGDSPSVERLNIVLFYADDWSFTTLGALSLILWPSMILSRCLHDSPSAHCLSACDCTCLTLTMACSLFFLCVIVKV